MNVPPDDLSLPVIPETIGLTPADRPAEAGRKILLYYFAVMLQREPGARLGEDIEQLHDMRVSTRRMRAALEIFGAAYKPKAVRGFAQGLKKTAKILGVVRDWDVFLDKAQHDIAQLPPEFQTALQPVITNWQEQRSSARRKLLEHLESKDYR